VVAVAALVTLAALGLTGCTTTPRRPAAPPAAKVAVPELVRVRVAGRVVPVPLEDYVLGAALAEAAPVDEPDTAVARIYEVQAIVARTYAVSQLGRHGADGFDLCDTTHCQLYDPARATTSRFAAVARAAVARTRGRILLFGDHVAEALFHADCGGQTAAADAVWGGRAVPYLSTIVDALPPATHRAWHLSATTEQLRAALNADARTAVGRTLDAIEILSRDASGRAAGLGVRGERGYTVRGDVLRTVLNQALGVQAVQSTRFTLTRTGTRYVFDGTGFGHGVGLCQRGAATRARQGESVDSILLTYFPGARLN
jgi:stage II sporulation protein D